MTSIISGATGGGEARAATSIAGGGRGQGEGWDEEVKGGSDWRGGVQWGEGRSQRQRVKAVPTEDVAADVEATGGGNQGDGGRRCGEMTAVFHGGVARGCGRIAVF